MPLIHIRSYAGRDLGVKQKAALAIVKAASEAMNAPETSFTVIYEDLDRETWDAGERDKYIEPISDLILYARGELVQK